jgi:hypothetical protein
MSCGCNSNPCSCLPRPSVCCTPTTESVEYTFENANLAGIGVFDNDTDNLVQFRGIVSDSASLTVTLNATDNTIVFDFDDAALVADIPDATTTQRGILETSTNAEALAKAATDKILTPSNLAALGSTTTFAGLVELATEAETITGTSTTLAVTPAGLAAAGQLTGMTTWADAVTRAGATPTFDGQLGTQLDINVPFVANGTGAGDFDVPLYIQGANTMVGNTTITTTGFGFTFDGTGEVTVGCSGGFSVTTDANLIGALTIIGNGSGEILNLDLPTLQISGVSMAESLLGADGSGLATEYATANFLSLYNVQNGWGTPTGTLARTTFAAYAGQTVSNPPTQAEVQAIDDALVIASRRLAALVTDILAIKLPAT